jgi:hypothetical protein
LYKPRLFISLNNPQKLIIKTRQQNSKQKTASFLKKILKLFMQLNHKKVGSYVSLNKHLGGNRVRKNCPQKNYFKFKTFNGS